MSQKTLKTKRVYAYAIYNSLRSTPPKDYPTTEEIKITINDILPSLKTHITEYLAMMKIAEELSVSVAAKEMTDSEMKPKLDKVNGDWKVYSKEHGQDEVEVVLDGESFTKLKEQFNRDDWGKKWLVNIEEFGELLKSFADAEK